MNKECVFCHLSEDRVLMENESAKAFYDVFPVSDGHTLIVPKRHVANYFDLTPQEREDIHSLLEQMKLKLDAEKHPDGYNVGVNVNEAAGQSVFHVHVHLIPRYKNDVPNPRGGVRGVIPSKQNY